jgi:squalene synthase HpnC
MRALAQSIAALGLPRGPFERLIEANRREHEVGRIATYDELIESCRFSAMPVGELVLHIFGAATPERIALSDDVCAGLQLVEHLQDVREDRRRGHIYLPQSDLRRFGVTMADLDADRPGTALRGALMYEIRVARRLLSAGIPLIRSLPVRDGLAVALFVAGGRAALDAIERAGYDVLGARPRPTGVLLARALGRTLRQADLLKAGGA